MQVQSRQVSYKECLLGHTPTGLLLIQIRTKRSDTGMTKHEGVGFEAGLVQVSQASRTCPHERIPPQKEAYLRLDKW